MKSQMEKNNLDIQFAPLCFFLDLAMVGTLLQFSKVIGSAKSKVVSDMQSSLPPSTRRQNDAKNLHNLVLDDLNLNHNYDVTINPAFNPPVTSASPPSLKSQVYNFIF